MDELTKLLETDLPNLVDILTKQDVKNSLKRPLEEKMLQKALDLESAEKNNYNIRLPQVLMRLVSFPNFAQVVKFIQSNSEHFHQYESKFIKSYFQSRQPTSAQMCLILEIFEKSSNTGAFLRFVEDLRRNRHIHINHSVLSSSNARKLLQILFNKINEPTAEYNHKNLLFMLKHLNEFEQNNNYSNPFQRDGLFMLFRRVLEVIKAKMLREGLFDDIKIDDL